MPTKRHAKTPLPLSTCGRFLGKIIRNPKARRSKTTKEVKVALAPDPIKSVIKP